MTPEQNPSPPPTTAVTTKPKFDAESAHEIGLPSPEAINYMMSVAKLIFNGALIGKDMRLSNYEIDNLRKAGWTEDAIATKDEQYIQSNILSKMLVGRSFGLDPIEAQQEMDIVKGKVFVRYPTLIRELEKRGLNPQWLERSNTRAAIEVTKKDRKPEIYEFTIEDAKMAGLLERGRNNEPSMYEKRPRVMLCSKVAGEAYRMSGGKANVYTDEERSEIEHDQPSADDKQIAIIQQKANNPFVSAARMAEETKTAAPEPTEAKPAETVTVKTETIPDLPITVEPKEQPKPAQSTPPAAQTVPEPPRTRKTTPRPPAATPAPAEPAKAEASASAAEPEPETAIVDKIKARFAELWDQPPFNTVSMAKVVPWFSDFMRGLLSFEGPVSRQAGSVWPAMSFLEYAIAKHSKRLMNSEESRELGNQVAACSLELKEFAKEIGWPAVMVTTLIQVNGKHLDPADASTAKEWILDTVKLDQMAPEDASAFLRACIPSLSIAVEVRTISVKSKQPIHLVVEWIEKYGGKAVADMTAQELTQCVQAAHQHSDKIGNVAADNPDEF